MSTKEHEVPVNIEVVAVPFLNDTLINKWTVIQNSDPAFASPFFSPGFTRLMGDSKDRIYVAILQRGDDICGFFPFEDHGEGRGAAIGYGYSDYQGVIVKQGFDWSARQLLASIGFKSFTFDHLIASQAQLFLPHGDCEPSFTIDLVDGYDAYAARLRGERRNLLVQTNRKRRKLECEVGTISFLVHEPDPKLLNLLLNWKANQWAESGHPRRFSRPWEQSLMNNLLQTANDGFSGLMSVLFADGQVAAIHLGMRSHCTWHYWTPAYNRKLARYSLGIILLDQMLRVAPSLGINTFDLGKEDFIYKRRLMTGTETVFEGTCLA